MSAKFDSQLNELLDAGIITPEIDRKIREYYEAKHPDKSGNRMLLTFGILGALLVGLGAILIIAHNWDQLSRPVKLAIAFFPLLASQGFCAYTLFIRKRPDHLVEVAAALLCFATKRIPASTKTPVGCHYFNRKAGRDSESGTFSDQFFKRTQNQSTKGGGLR